MAVLTEDKEVVEKDGIKSASPMAVDQIFRGALLMHNSAGFLAPAANGAGSFFAGIADENVDNTAGSAGDLTCKYQRRGLFLLEGTGFVQGDVGEQVFASDDQTVTKTSTNNVRVGRIELFESATQVWVYLEKNGPVSA